MIPVGDEIFVAGAVTLRDGHPFFWKQGSVLLVSDYGEAKFFRVLWWRLFGIVGILLTVMMGVLFGVGLFWKVKALAAFAGFMLIAVVVWFGYTSFKIHGMNTLQRS